MRRIRRPFTPASLDDLSYVELSDLAARGRISYADIKRILHERVIARHGGRHPYQHLRDELNDGAA